MRRIGFWIPAGVLAALLLTFWGVWTQRLSTANQIVSMELEAERQRSFNDVAYHVEQIQASLGKGLVTGSTRQNMRYMSDVYHHSRSAMDRFTSLPLPAEVSATLGKFVQQTGDFAASLLSTEAAGGEMNANERAELVRLRQEATNLSGQLQGIMQEYNLGGIRWTAPLQFTWGNLLRAPGTIGKPPTGQQAPQSLLHESWEQMSLTMNELPVMVYNGPFSDHLGERQAAVSGPPVTVEQAQQRVQTLVPNMQEYAITGVEEVNGNMPAYSFRLTPAQVARGGQTTQYTAVAEVTRNGGQLLQFLNIRAVGNPTIDLERAQEMGQQHLQAIGYEGMVPTYSQVQAGTATLAYALQQGNVLIYPDQIKVKIALDNGEILGVDARQYLMAHHDRALDEPKVPATMAQMRLNGEAQPQRAQLTLIPDLDGAGEILAWEFVTEVQGETFLVYIDATTGQEVRILQKIQTDGGTFAL